MWWRVWGCECTRMWMPQLKTVSAGWQGWYLLFVCTYWEGVCACVFSYQHQLLERLGNRGNRRMCVCVDVYLCIGGCAALCSVQLAVIFMYETFITIQRFQLSFLQINCIYIISNLIYKSSEILNYSSIYYVADCTYWKFSTARVCDSCIATLLEMGTSRKLPMNNNVTPWNVSLCPELNPLLTEGYTHMISYLKIIS